MKNFLAKAIAVLFVVCIAQVSPAQNYPNKPIRFVVPYPPGGAVDIYARLIAQKLTERLQWSTMVENRPGAGGNIGMEAAARAVPDGYTLVIGQSSNMAISPALYPNLGFNPMKDLTPIVTIANSPLIVVVSNDSPFKKLGDMVTAAKKIPNSVMIASSGNGTAAHLTIQLLASSTNASIQHIPYKGTTPAIADLIGGQISGYMSTIASAAPFIQTGRIRAISVADRSRAAQLPGVPTTAEEGMAGITGGAWWGVFAPAKVPPEILRELNTEINTILRLPDVIEKVVAGGGQIVGGTAEELAVLIKNDTIKWSKIIKDAGIKND